MMWNTQYHDGRQDSELGVMRHDPPDMESGHAEHQNSSALHHSTHDLESARLPPAVALEVSKPGGALLLSSTIRPLLTAPSSETSNDYYIHDRWSSSTSRDNALSNKQTTGTSSQSSFLLTDENAPMQPGMNINVSSSLTGSISNDNEMGGRVGARMINWQQQQAVLSAMSSEVVRNSMMTIKSHPVETYSAEEKEVPYHSLHFPWRLHQMLEAAESHGFSHIVSWLPELQDGHHHKSTRTHLRSDSTRLTDSDEMEQELSSSPLSRKKRIAGTPFRVHEPGIFEKVIMPRFFRQTKFKSFRRQINLWSFERIRNGPNKGGYQSDYFVRTNPSLCARMRRSKSKRPLQDHDEDFATQSAASSSILEQQQQQEVTATGSMVKSSGVSSAMFGSQLHNPPTISVTPASAIVASQEHTSMMMPRGQEGGTQTTTATTTTNTDQHFHTGNSLSSSSLSWFESHQVSLLNYAYTVMRVSQNDTSVSNLDCTVPAPLSNDSSTDDIEQELISTFCPAFHMLLDSEDNNTRHTTLNE